MRPSQAPTSPATARPWKVAAAGQRKVATGGPAFQLLYLYLCWGIIMMDPQWFLAKFVGTAVLQVPTVLFGILLVMVLLRMPRMWYVPFAAFFAYTAANLPFAYNPPYALTPTKQLFLYYVLALATLTFVRTARQALPIIGMFFVYQYIWWDQGALSGLVSWHPTNSNYDGFGPLMAIAIPTCFYFALATKNRPMRLVAVAIGAVCVLGLVSSFARGAELSGAAVLGWVWLRSPRKGVTTAALAGVALVVGLSTVLLFSNVKRGDAKRNFWQEMATILAPDDTTEQDRKVLWNLAKRVYAVNPVFGVGAENFGPFAAGYFQPGETGGAYDENPQRLFDRKLHSSYFQILCEYGTVGGLLWLWLLFDFWRKNSKLRTPAHLATWKAAVNGKVDLRYLSLGIEASLVAFLCGAFFYNQIFVHWLYTILTMNMLLYVLSKPKGSPAVLQRRRAIAA